MAETPELMQPQTEADPATLAFEALREEVALARRAVAGLAAERASIEIPDYSETLGQIMRASSATRQSVKALAEMPALRLSAKDWSHEIATAAQEARRSDQQALANAQHGLERMIVEMAAHLRSARSAERQRQWLIWTTATGIVAGMLLLAIIVGPVVRAIPESWHWPERMAASISRHGRGNRRRASHQNRRAGSLARHRRRLPNYQRQSRCNRAMRTKRGKNDQQDSLRH